MAGLRLDGGVVVEYANTAEAAAAELEAAADFGDEVTAESYGDLGVLVGLDVSYARAAGALRRQLVDGAEALRSAAEALRILTARHGAHDAESAELLKRVGGLDA